MMEWIRVNDRYPKQGQLVLCYSSDFRIFTAIYSREKTNYEPYFRHWWDHGYCCGREPEDPIYWMPLPEPPKENP